MARGEGKPPVSLGFITRTIYIIYYAKWFLGVFYPELAQEYTDFCRSCTFDGAAGQLSAAYESWGYFFVALVFTAVAQFSDDKDQRKVLQYGLGLFAARFWVLVNQGKDALTYNDVGLQVSLAENAILCIGCILTCYLWYPLSSPRERTDRWDKSFTDLRTGIRVAYLEQIALFCFSYSYLYNGDIDKMIPNEGGELSAALATATQFGLALTLMGVAQVADHDMKKVAQYYMIKKIVELFYLAMLASPFVIAADGENGINGCYWTCAWYIFTLVHLLCICYHGPIRRSAFWVAAIVAFLLGVLGIHYPTTTAAAYYRVADLDGMPAAVFKIIGLGCIIFGAAFMSFAHDYHMASFEVYFSYTYGGILLFNIWNGLYHGLFSDLLNFFLFWCIWQHYSYIIIDLLHPLLPDMAYHRAIKVADVTSPKSAKKNAGRGRSKTPGKK